MHDSGAPPLPPVEKAGNKTILGQPVPPAVAQSTAPAATQSTPPTSSPPFGGSPPVMSTESQPIQLPQTPAAAALTEALGSFDGDAFKSTARAFFDFNLDKIVTRSLAKVLYALSWIEAAAVLLIGWYNAVMGMVNGAIGVGLAMVILAPLGAIGVLIVARIVCELMILAVSSHEALQDVRAALKE